MREDYELIPGKGIPLWHYFRCTIDIKDLPQELVMVGPSGHLFHHLYVNGNNELCTRLSERNSSLRDGTIVRPLWEHVKLLRESMKKNK